MNRIRLTRLGDFMSGASSAVLILAIPVFQWWLIAVGLLLFAIAIGLYVQSRKSN